MAVTTEQVNALYQRLLGRPGAQQYLQDWANSGMTIDQIAEAIKNSPEGVSYSESQSPVNTPTQQNTETSATSLTSQEEQPYVFYDPNEPIGPDVVTDNPAYTATLGTIKFLFERHFGRPPTSEETRTFMDQYNLSGDIDAVDAAIVQAAQTNFGATEASEGIQAGAELEAMRPVVQELYQELFGREAGQQGMDYWLSQLRSGATTPEGLRDALISGATGDDLAYYNQNVLNPPPPEEPAPDDTSPDVGTSGPIPDDEVVEEEAGSEDGAGTTDTTTTTDPTTTTTTTDPTTTTTDPTTTPTGTGVGTTGTGTEDQTVQTGGGTPAVNQYQGLFDLLDQRYPNLGGKGGAQQPQAPIISEPEPNPYGQGGGDFYSGGGYYRNPYSSGYGMGYQDPYASQRYMPRQGLLGPTGFGGGKGGVPMSPYGSSYGSPYGSSFGSPFGSPYGSPYGSPGKGGGFSRPPTPAKGGGFGQPQLPPRDTTGLTPMGGNFLGDGNGLASGIDDGTIAMQPGDQYGGNRISIGEDADGNVHSYGVGDMMFALAPGESVPDDVMQQYLMQQERDRLPPQTQGGQQGRLSQEAVLGGMDPASDQMMGAPRPTITTPPPFPPPSYTPPTTIVDDFRPYFQAQVGPVRPRPMMAQPAGMRYRQPMSYGGKGGYYR